LGKDARAFLDSADWGNEDFIEEFTKNFNSLGEAFIGINQAASNSNAVYNLASLQSPIKTINSVLNSVKKVGDTIDLATYESLPEDLKDAFTVLNDGTIAFIGNAS
jgi:hypothetical protein